jgi:hypothetical protein
MRRSRQLSLLLSVYLIFLPTRLYAFSEEEQKLAAKYFSEFAEFCQKSDRTLWPIGMCRPTIFAEPGSRAAMLDSPDPERKFTKAGGIFSGQLPLSLPIANTSVTWAGQLRTMLMWPLPNEQRARLALYAHESFHGIQNDLGLPVAGVANAHLDDEQARVLLRLEWRALARALQSNEDVSRRAAVRAALSFREKRFAQYSTAAKEEAAMELHEGLAEYTGIALAYGRDARAQVVTQFTQGEQSSTLSRSFAYFSGPAYGLLLDAESAAWRQEISKQLDLAMMLKDRLQFDVIAAPTQEMLAEYSGSVIRAEERQRAEKQIKRVADIRTRLVDGATLRLPLKNMQFEMNPQNIFNLPDGSQYHETLKVSDDWGEIRVMKGALIVGWKELRVAAPTSAGSTQTDAWILKLKPSWILAVSGENYQAQVSTPTSTR